MISLLRITDVPWEAARGYLRLDLETIVSSANQQESVATTRFNSAFTRANPVINDGNSGGSLGVDWGKGPRHRCTLTANVAFTFLNPVDGGDYTIFIQTGAGSFTATWASTVSWTAGTAPTITATANKVDVVRLQFVSALNKYYASISQNY